MFGGLAVVELLVGWFSVDLRFQVVFLGFYCG